MLAYTPRSRSCNSKYKRWTLCKKCTIHHKHRLTNSMSNHLCNQHTSHRWLSHLFTKSSHQQCNTHNKLCITNSLPKSITIQEDVSTVTPEACVLVEE